MIHSTQVLPQSPSLVHGTTLQAKQTEKIPRLEGHVRSSITVRVRAVQKSPSISYRGRRREIPALRYKEEIFQ